MERFTAAQARKLMPNRFDEMIEQIHNAIRVAALNGKINVSVTFSNDYNVNGYPYKVKNFLEKEEGYEVLLTNGMKTVEFFVSWRD